MLLEVIDNIWNIDGIYLFFKENRSFAGLQSFALIICLLLLIYDYQNLEIIHFLMCLSNWNVGSPPGGLLCSAQLC